MAAGSWFVGEGSFRLGQNYKFNKNASAVEEAVNKEDFDNAKALLNRANELSGIYHKHTLRPEDEERLRGLLSQRQQEYANSLKKKEGIKSLEESLSTPQSFSKAQVVLQSLESSQLYAPQEMKSFREQVNALTEEGLERKFVSITNALEALPTAEKYLEWYPQGRLKAEALAKVANARVQDLKEKIKPSSRLISAHNSLFTLNQFLEKYRAQLPQATLHGTGLNKEIINEIESYIAAQGNYEFYEFFTEPFKIGENVQTRRVPEEFISFNKAYLTERNSNLPAGSLGQIVDIHDSLLEVKFSQSTNIITWLGKWWDVEQYGQNVGLYCYAELLKMPSGRKKDNSTSDKLKGELKTLGKYIDNLNKAP